jgi:hypothetical protein
MTRSNGTRALYDPDQPRASHGNTRVVVPVDPEAVREEVVRLRAWTPTEQWSGLVHQDIHDGLDDLAAWLVEEHGLDAVLRALTPHRADNNLAELLFHLFWANHRNMLPVFSEAEIVDAASRFLMPLRGGASERADERDLPGWGWRAVSLHSYGRTDHLTNEQHFRILLALVDRLPPDDKILWMIGNGPLAHAQESLEYRRRIAELETPSTKIARAIELARKNVATR